MHFVVDASEVILGCGDVWEKEKLLSLSATRLASWRLV